MFWHLWKIKILPPDFKVQMEMEVHKGRFPSHVMVTLKDADIWEGYFGSSKGNLRD